MSDNDNTSQESGGEDNYILSASKNKKDPEEITENGDSGKEEKVDPMDTTNMNNICKDQLVSDKDDHKLEPE